jgi:radical SAM superfamily enzyme YgiQ (UPF0313 family)
LKLKQQLYKQKKILLTSVFKPFGIDDNYGRKENRMESFHNQITRGQGIASLRTHHRSFGLYLIAANIDADVNVLDFPTLKRFIREVRKGYDAIGISFVVPNYHRTKEMCRIIRKIAPDTDIIIGGHGTGIDGLKKLIDCDYIVKGEGIQWMRQYLQQEASSTFFHPLLPTCDYFSIFGIKIPFSANVLVTGFGCSNACNFCSTSHFFGKKYIPLLKSGTDIFNMCYQLYKISKTKNILIYDENFLTDKKRALELIAEMEKHNLFFNFWLFSSAKAVVNLGIENLIKLGVDSLWIGFETDLFKNIYEKNNDIDAKQLVCQLRDAGITIIGSCILGLKHHTKENIHHDINFMIDLEADMIQFMLLIALPGTTLYKNLEKKGLIRKDLPYEEWHGQKLLNSKHSEFSDNFIEKTLNNAFKKEYKANSSSVYRNISTYVRGYHKLSSIHNKSSVIKHRIELRKNYIAAGRIILPIIYSFAANELERKRIKKLENEIYNILGPLNFIQKLQQIFTKIKAYTWYFRVKVKDDVIQPRTIYTKFNLIDKRTEKTFIKLIKVAPFPIHNDTSAKK